jgi:hypothetical protein
MLTRKQSGMWSRSRDLPKVSSRSRLGQLGQRLGLGFVTERLGLGTQRLGLGLGLEGLVHIPRNSGLWRSKYHTYCRRGNCFRVFCPV